MQHRLPDENVIDDGSAFDPGRSVRRASAPLSAGSRPGSRWARLL